MDFVIISQDRPAEMRLYIDAGTHLPDNRYKQLTLKRKEHLIMAGEKSIKVLAAIDGSPMSETVLKHCGRYVQISGCDLTLIHVLEDVIPFKTIPDTPLYQERKQEGFKILEDARKTLESHGVTCKTILAAGPVAAEIVRIAEENQVDYIFMGHRGLRGLKRMLLGSVADDVSKYAHCAVTIIR
jgi:nucleotide-binding universal stress UspA family protein